MNRFPNEQNSQESVVHLLENSRTESAEPLPIDRREKSGSRIRDHLANERTYLAWMRTAIALMGFGVVIARLRYLLAPNEPGTGQGWALGLLFICTGLLTVLLSTQHYFMVLQAIDANTYEPSSRWVVLFSLILLLLGTGVIYVLFSMPSGSRMTFSSLI